MTNLDALQADTYRQGREHAIKGGALLSQTRIDRVRVMVRSQNTVGEWNLTNGEIESLVDSYTEGYSLGLDEHAQLNDDAEVRAP